MKHGNSHKTQLLRGNKFALNSIDFIVNNISAAVKIIPHETITSMEDIDFDGLSDEEMGQMQEIMTDMNRKKMDDFKEMVTSMVVLEKQGFEAQASIRLIWKI